MIGTPRALMNKADIDGNKVHTDWRGEARGRAPESYPRALPDIDQRGEARGIAPGSDPRAWGLEYVGGN